MPYTPTTWVENSTTLGPTNLNHLETGVAAAIPKDIVTTAGDLIYATGSATVARLAAGLAGQVLGGTGPTYAYPPGYEIAYDQITSPINVASTTEGTPTAIIAGSAKTYENVPYLFEFYCPELVAPSTTAGSVIALLMQDGASIGRLTVCVNDITGGQTAWACSAKLRFTPSAASHTYGVSAYCSATTGTPSVQAGAGGAGVIVPAFLRVTKV